MKKNFKYYALIWVVLLAVWCAVVITIRPLIPGFVSNTDTAFWIAFVLIIAACIGNLVCAYFDFQADNLKKMFLNLPLITVSWSSLIIMLVVVFVLMLIPNCPTWIATIVCIVLLALNVIALIKAMWVTDTVNTTEKTMNEQISFVKNLIVNADSILARAKSEAVKAECKKVYEAVRYSDPVSNEALSEIEAKITLKMDEFSSTVRTDDVDKAKEIASEIVALVGDRNKKCKSLK